MITNQNFIWHAHVEVISSMMEMKLGTYLWIGATLLGTSAFGEKPEHTKVYENQFDKSLEIDTWSDARLRKAPNGESFLGMYSGRDTLYQKIAELPPHRFVRVRFDLLALISWDGVSKIGGQGPDTWALSVKGGPLLMLTSFSNQMTILDEEGVPPDDAVRNPRPQSYPDEFPCSLHPPATGADRLGPKLGFEFPWHDFSSVSSLYKIDIVFPHTGSDLTLQYTGNLSNREPDESWGIDNVIIETIDTELPLTDKELSELWLHIKGKDPVAANAAVWKVLAGGPKAAAFINKAWVEMEAAAAPPVAAEEALKTKLAGIIGKLSSDEFVERQRANTDLQSLGQKALPLLEAELGKAKDPERRRALKDAVGRLTKKATATKKRSHSDLVRSRIEHINRIIESHTNGYKITSSAAGAGKEFPNDPIGAAADGYIPDDSSLQVVPRFTWSPKKGTEEWLQYEFPKAKTISKAEVFWFEPFEHTTLLPTEWKVVYRTKAGTWEPVETKDKYEITPDKLNQVSFKPVETDAIRLIVQLPAGEGGGVYEFRVLDGK